MIVTVHRQPVKERRLGTWVRTQSALESKNVFAEVVPGLGIQVSFPLCGVYLFNMYDGSGRGTRMKDWVIDPRDLALLLAERKKKKDVVPASANG